MTPLPPKAREWTPAPVPASLVVTAPAWGRAWTAWLKTLGYTGAEVRELVDGDGDDPESPGLREWLPDRLAEREAVAEDQRPMEIEDIRSARAGIVADYLEARPPVLVHALEKGPPWTLAPIPMGARLTTTGTATDMGSTLYRDVVTGLLWSVRTYATRAQAGQTVIAAALYRLAGVASPALRLVEVGGRQAVAWPELHQWPKRSAAVLASDYGAELAKGLAADSWLDNVLIPSGIRVRALPIAGTATTLRANLAGCLEWRGSGRKSTGWTPGTSAILHAAMAPKGPAIWAAARATPETVQAGARRVVSIPEAKIRQAVALGGLTAEGAAALLGTLVGRREAIRTWLD